MRALHVRVHTEPPSGSDNTPTSLRESPERGSNETRVSDEALRQDPSKPSIIRILHPPAGSGWFYPTGDANKREPNTKILVIRGVRFFSFRYYTNKADERLLHSFIPFSNYVIVLYDPEKRRTRFNRELRCIPELHSIAGFMKVSTGEFLPSARWTQEELAEDKEVIAVYNREDEVERLLVNCAGLDPAKLPPELEVGKYDHWIDPREDWKVAYMRKHFKFRSYHFKGPHPLYIDELLQTNGTERRQATTWDRADIFWLDGRRFKVPPRPTYRPISSFEIVQAGIETLFACLGFGLMTWFCIILLL